MREVIPGCDAEGALLDLARKNKKKKDNRYTQDFTAALVGKGQYIWSQWQSGRTRIIDKDWLILALDLDFDPFATRPELRELAQLIHKAEAKFLNKSAVGEFSQLVNELDPSSQKIIVDLVEKLSANSSTS